MKSLFSVAVLNEYKLCMVLYDVVGSRCNNEVSDLKTRFYLEYSMID